MHGLFHAVVKRCIITVSAALFPIAALPVSLRSNNDSLYEKISTNELIRKADSVFTYKDDYPGARYFYLKALARLGPAEQELQAYCFVKLSNTYTSEQNYPEAATMLKKADEILSDTGNGESMIRAEFDLYAGKYLQRTHLTDSAGRYLDRSIRIKKKYITDYPLSLAESLFFKAQLYDELNQLAKSEVLYREIIKIYNKVFDHENYLYGRVYSSLASCLRKQFDYRNAADYARQALNIYSLDSAYNVNRIVIASIIYANIYNATKDYGAAIPIYMNLLKLLKKSGLYKLWIPDTYINLITAYIKTGQLTLAENCLTENKEFLENEGLWTLSAKALLTLQYGAYYVAAGEIQKARKALTAAIGIYKDQLPGQIEYYSYGYMVRGDMFLKMGIMDSALINYQQSMVVYLDNFENTDICSNPVSQDDPDKRKIFDILYRKAGAFRKYYDSTADISYLAEALKIYNLIDQLNDQARNSMIRDASMLILNDYYHPGYETAVDCAYELFRRTKDTSFLNNAFMLMEKNKSMLLYKSITLAERSRSVNLSYSIKSVGDSLRLLYSDYERSIKNEKEKTSPDPDRINLLESGKFSVTDELYNLKIRIAREFPAYFQIKYNVLINPLNDFQDLCRNRNLFGIEYFWGDSAIYQLWTDGTASGINKIANTGKLRKALAGLLNQLAAGVDFTDPALDFRNYISNATSVFQDIVADIPITGHSHLMVVPDGPLAQLPFEALLTGITDTTFADYSTLPYLVRESDVQYAYSINLLLIPERTNETADNNLLGFSYSGLSIPGKHDSPSDINDDLPYSARELKAIDSVMPGNNLFLYDSEATEINFKKQAPNYRILHLAIHGLADSEDEYSARLEFNPGTHSEDDHEFYISELYGMDLSRTQLAVLSACETGIGKEFRGEGVFSMARGFIYAGCPSVVMSLWKVRDIHTKRIMENFYRHLVDGNPGSGALQLSKIDFIRRHDSYLAHPANWASFVMLGKEFKYKEPVNLHIRIILLTVVTVVVIWFFRKAYRVRPYPPA